MAKKMHDRPCSPVRIGGVEIENRVAMTPMGVNLAAAAGGVNEDIITFNEGRAGGGIGLAISAIGQVTDGAGASEPCQFAAPGSANPQGLEQFVDAVHQPVRHPEVHAAAPSPTA